jgi:hypothetical protein
MSKGQLPIVTPKELMDLLCILEKMDNPPALMVFGPPGVGKTTILKDFAESRDYELRVKHLSRMDSTDWSGIPKQSQDYTEFLPISLFKPPKKKRLVIFFDELNTAMPQVLNAALDVILEKKADSETFSEKASFKPETIILAAGNLGPDEDGTYVEELSMAVKTRLIQVRLETNLKDWKDWAIEKKIHPKIISYIDSEEKLIDYNAFKNNEKQAPTPRGWERLSNIIKTIEENITEKQKRNNLVKIFSIGAVGVKRGNEFFEFYLKGSENFEEIRNNIELTIADLKKISETKYPGNLTSDFPKHLDTIENAIQNGSIKEDDLKDAINYIEEILNGTNESSFTTLRGKILDNLLRQIRKYGKEDLAKKLEEYICR